MNRNGGWPAVSPDGLTLVYGFNDGGPTSEDLFTATRGSTSEAFGAGVRATATSAAEAEASALISADSTTLDRGLGAATATLTVDQLTRRASTTTRPGSRSVPAVL